MRVRLKIFYYLVALIFLFGTLAEAGFLADAEGVVVGKKTFRMWGLPTGRRLVIRYQEPDETEPERLAVRYARVPVTYSVYGEFQKGDKLEKSKFSLIFFRNDESVTFSWDTRWTVSTIMLAFLCFVAFFRRVQPCRHGRAIRYGRYYMSQL